MKGLAGGPDVGDGNYGSVVCVACENANHTTFIIKDTQLILLLCPGCGEISAAFKIDAAASSSAVAAEVESRKDVAAFVRKFKEAIASSRGKATEEPSTN